MRASFSGVSHHLDCRKPSGSKRPSGGVTPISKAIAKALVDRGVTVAISGRDAEALERDVHPSEHKVPPELQRSGRLFGGIINDMKRRYPLYGSDLKDGFNSKTFASVFFLFFACLAPAVTWRSPAGQCTD